LDHRCHVICMDACGSHVKGELACVIPDIAALIRVS
jgi:hypothetical protein